MLKNCYAGCLLAISMVANCAVILADAPPVIVAPSLKVKAKLVLDQEPKISVKDLAFSPDSTALVTIGVLPKEIANGKPVKVRLWNTQTGQMTRELKSDLPTADELMRSNAPVYLNDPLSWSDPLENNMLNSPLLITYSPDGKMIAISTDTVSLWDAQTGQFLRPLRWAEIVAGILYPDNVTSIEFSPDSKKLIVGITSRQSKLRVFDVQTGAQLQTLITSHYSGGGGFASIMPVKISPDGKLIATGGTPVQLWDSAEATSNNTQTKAD